MPRAVIRPYGSATIGRFPGRDLVPFAPRGAVPLGPSQALAAALLLATLGYIYREEINQVAQELAQVSTGDPEGLPIAAVTKTVKVKRKLSKANHAMRKAMKATKNNFKQATKIASKANPNTKSRIGKGTSKIQKLARKIRKSIWGKLRRKK